MRNLYLAFVLAFIVLVAGFWPTTFGQSQPVDGLRIVHGTLATLWTILLIIQSWLAGRWRIRPHRLIGWSTVAIVPALVVSSVMVVLDGTRHSTYFSRDLRITLAWADLVSLVLFTALWGLAIANRRRWPLHARYVGCTVLVTLPPALGRLYGMNLPWTPTLTAAIHPAYTTAAAIAGGLLMRDLIKRGHPLPYAITLLGTWFIEFTMLWAPRWPWFVNFLERVGPIG